MPWIRERCGHPLDGNDPPRVRCVECDTVGLDPTYVTEAAEDAA